MRGSYGNMVGLQFWEHFLDIKSIFEENKLKLVQVLLRLISSNCDSSQFSALVQFLVQEQQLEL